MSHELFYTSAPKGLHPGSQGYCTVACTKGMPVALLEKLESLSGYRPLYPPHDPKASANPVSFGHAPIQVGGKMYHVLSRVCFAGVDYTDRANKFAHHVALEAHELPPAGPAWLLRQPGFLDARWDGQVRHLPSGRMAPLSDWPPAHCREWQRQVGDAGWAGAVAESFLKNPDRPVYFLYEPGTDLLPMFVEALALLPSEQRWRVGLNTYLTGSASCPWRGLPRGGDDAAQARRIPGALIIPLGERLPPPPAGSLVEAARTGRAGQGAALAPPVAVAVAVPPPRPAPISRNAGSNHGVAKPVAAAAELGPPELSLSDPIAPAPRRGGFGLGLLSGVIASVASVAGLVMAGLVLIPAAGFGPPPLDGEPAMTTQTVTPPHDQEKVKNLQATLDRLNARITELAGERDRLSNEKNTLVNEKNIAEKLAAAKTEELKQAHLKLSQPAKGDANGEKLQAAIDELAAAKKVIGAKESRIQELDKELKRHLKTEPLDIVLNLGSFPKTETVVKLAMGKELKGNYTLPGLQGSSSLEARFKDKEMKLLFICKGKPIGETRDGEETLAVVGLENQQLTLNWEKVSKGFEKAKAELMEVLPNHLIKVTTSGGRVLDVSLRGNLNTERQVAMSESELKNLAKARIKFGDPKVTAPWRTTGWQMSMTTGLKFEPTPGAQILIEIDGKYVEIHRQP